MKDMDRATIERRITCWLFCFKEFFCSCCLSVSKKMFISLNRLRERKVFCFVEYNWRLRFEVFLAICLSSLCFGGESFNYEMEGKREITFLQNTKCLRCERKIKKFNFISALPTKKAYLNQIGFRSPPALGDDVFCPQLWRILCFETWIFFVANGNKLK